MTGFAFLTMNTNRLSLELHPATILQCSQASGIEEATDLIQNNRKTLEHRKLCPVYASRSKSELGTGECFGGSNKTLMQQTNHITEQEEDSIQAPQPGRPISF